MKECPNCHCQVVSEVKICPYCGTELEYASDRTETVYSAQKREAPFRKLDSRDAYGNPVGQPVGYPQQYRSGNSYYPQGYPPSYMWPPVYEERNSVPIHEKNEQKGNSLIYILVALLGCMIAANVLELVAILLLLK